jgi:putative drug exporter of the RND superfamily
MDRIFEYFGRAIVRFRFLVVLGWIVVALVATLALPSMDSEVNNNNAGFLASSAPSQQAAALAAPVTGATSSDSQIFIVAARSGSRLTADDQAAITREAAAARTVGRVLAVRQAGTSPDGQAAQLLVTANVSQMDQDSQTAIIDNLRATFAQSRAPAGLQFHLAGPIATAAASNAQSGKAGGTVQVASVVFILILLLIIFRSLLAPVVTLLPAVFALLISMRFIGGLGEHGLKVSEITSLLLVILLLGAGTDYGLFLVFRVREEIRGGLKPHDAVRVALVRVGESISASAGTVILALLTLLAASFGVYHDLAVPLAVGVAVMLLAGLTLLPALLAILGRALFWPTRIVAGPQKDGVWGRIAVRLVRRPAVTLVLGLALFGGLAAFTVGYRAGGFGGSTSAPVGSDAAAGDALMARHFPHSSADPGNLVFRYSSPVWQNGQALVAAQRALRASGEFTQLTGPLNANGNTLSPAQFADLHAQLGDPGSLSPIPPVSGQVPAAEYEAYRASAQFVSGDGRTIQFEAEFVAGGQQSTDALNAVPGVRAAVGNTARQSSAVASGVAGQAASLYDVSSTSSNDLIRVFPIAILAIGLLLALVLRSLIAPLYLIFSVALSYLAALGTATLLFVDLGGNGLTFVLPFLMFIFLLALGEDYNILVMTRIREETRNLPIRDAVSLAVSKTGPTVTSAGLILAGTFGVLAVSGGGGQITDVGAGLAIGILMDTFLVRTLLVPSMVVLLGRWNWWPSRMSRRGRQATAIPSPVASPK